MDKQLDQEINHQAPSAQPTAPHGMSEDTKTLITVLLLFFAYPVGLILMWVWTKWKLWIKILLTLPVPLIIFSAFMFTVVLVAINPAGQMAKARDAQRKSDLYRLSTALELYKAENSAYPSSVTENPAEISSNGADICNDLVPTFIAALPVDPALLIDGLISDCSNPYSTSYVVYLNSEGIITFTAPNAELGEVITLTR